MICMKECEDEMDITALYIIPEEVVGKENTF